MSEPHTICDVDHTFYKIIEGRPLRQFDDIKVYMRNIRDITLFKANAAYLKDQIIQVDTSFAFENAEHKAIDRLFWKVKDYFVQFAKESYTTAKNIQKIAEDKARQLEAATEELEALCFNFVAVRNKLGVIIINFETLSKYRQFLNNLSPAAWREKYDQQYEETKSLVSAKESDYKTSATMLKDIAPKLFFTRPRQMSIIFDNLSRQCLSYMQIDVFASSLLASVMKSRDYLKVQVMEEIDELQDLVETYRGYVEFMEGKEQEAKVKFERVLENEFQTLYASYDASKLFTCLQYTNTQVFHGPEDPKDSIMTLMLHLERDYMELSSGLDDLNLEVVKQATSEFFSEDLKMMKRAHKAQRDLKECDILNKALYTSFEPPRWKCKK
ncbi:uncharacterized protein LOC114352051 [Ostrinia furnacalis]|uniref:uncharacterized protein LOC114352051 n=1 Tax=Ostrinia furnacalis TaxID=93504 RepID=UPI00103B3DC2|nr:uncharacterized protein LOC114352051 [Ostrinia furnacalis]